VFSKLGILSISKAIRIFNIHPSTDWLILFCATLEGIHHTISWTLHTAFKGGVES
jgi:hypothetical protein